MGSDPPPGRRRAFRLRTLLGLVGVVAIVLGFGFNQMHRRAVRRALAQPLIDAAERGDAAEVRRLLGLGADLDSVTNGRFPWTPLMHAAFRGHADVVRLLIDRGADVDREDLDAFSAINLAADAGHWDAVGLLLDAGADPTLGAGYIRTALDHARAGAPPDLVRRLEARAR